MCIQVCPCEHTPRRIANTCICLSGKGNERVKQKMWHTNMQAKKEGEMHRETERCMLYHSWEWLILQLWLVQTTQKVKEKLKKIALFATLIS